MEALMLRLPVAVDDSPLAVRRQALDANGRAGDVAAQAFQPGALPCLIDSAGMR